MTMRTGSFEALEVLMTMVIQVVATWRPCASGPHNTVGKLGC